jgi:hypothetical protein
MKIPGLGRRREKLHLFHALAERLEQLGECLLGIGIGAIPVRGLDEGELRRNRRVLGSKPTKGNTGARARVRIAFIAACEHLGEQSKILDAARKEAHMIQRA